MPKRGHRGGSRGRGLFRGGGHGRGRGRGRGRGGRGGYIGGKRGRSRGARSGGPGGFNDAKHALLDDLSGDPDVYIPVDSMRASAKRTRSGRSRLQDEAFTTEENVEKTMRLPLWKRPVEFVQSDQLSDTTNVTALKAQERERIEADGLAGDVDQPAEDHLDVEVEAVEAGDVVAHTETIETKSAVSCNVGEPVLSDRVVPERPKKPTVQEKLQSLSDDKLFFVDETGSSSRIQIREEPLELTQPATGGSNTEFSPNLSIGHVHLSTKINGNGETVTQLPGDRNDFHVEPSEGDLYKSYQEYISNVMGTLFENDDDNEDDDDEVFAELDEDFEEEAKFMAEGVSKEEVADTSYMEQQTSASIQDGLTLKEKEPENQEPEYGFLPEDYESFDHSLVDIFNIREGFQSSQYLMKSFRLTGSYDTHWIDRELFEDFLLENGMPEHRLNAYFKYVKAKLYPEEEEEDDMDDISFDDSDSEEADEEEEEAAIPSDEEGLADLINFTKKYDGLRDMEFETHTLKTKGKGRKKQLDVDSITGEFGDILQQQWANDRQHKREKRKNRHSNIAEEHATSVNLCLKYPYTIYVKEMRNELEEFLSDSVRKSLTFPPLDPHGNRTVQNMAHKFNMKSRKFGSGNKQHVVVIKNKRTYRTIPDYMGIDRFLHQRPVFNRTDQRRPRSEIDQEKSSRRGKPSKAHNREGDIVGANAPEISSDNFGRRLLVKMGWKAGQGLGLGNDGISEPVMAKVKNSKLGIR